MTWPKMRIASLCAILIVVLGWNMALASRRKFYSGRIVKAERRDVELTVPCPAKFEPRVQSTIQSSVRGRKKTMLVREGDAVKKGQLLMEIDGEEIFREMNRKKIVMENATADMEKALNDLQLARTLFRKGAASSREVDDARQNLKRARQRLDETKEDLEVTAKKAQGIEVRSPLSGIVLNILVQRDEIADGQDLIRVAEINDLLVRGKVDELDIARVKIGQPVAVRVDAYRGVEIPARVEWIGPQARDGAFAEVEVVLKIDDTKGLDLKPNLSCEGRIITGKLPNAIVVPAEAVRRDTNGTHVFKAQLGGWLSKRVVEVAGITEGSVVIKTGLDEGDSILVPEKQ